MGNLFEVINPLTTTNPISRNQSIYLKGKSIDWFLYDGNIGGTEARAYFSQYCVWYPHAVSFLRNKMPYFLLKIPKTHAVYGGVAF